MKIVHIIPALANGGAERLVIDIVKELNTHEGVTSKLIIFRDRIAYDISAIAEDLHIIPSSIQISPVRRNKFQVDQLQNFIEKFNPDVIHTHLFEAEVVAKSCFFPKATWFCHFHDNMAQLQTFKWQTLTDKKLLFNFFERSFLIKRNRTNTRNNYVAISMNAERYAKKVLPKSAPINYLRNAINVKTFLAEIKMYDSGRQLKLINVGSFQKKKNQQFLMDIMKELKNRGVDAHLNLLGEGAERESVIAKAKELEVDKMVSFKGNVNNVQDYLTESDIYVHSAYYEPFGLVLLEAMAAGLPVVSLNGGGNVDIIDHDMNGYIFDHQDPEVFANCINTLLLDKEKYNRIASAGQATAQNYDISDYAQRLKDLYQRVIDLK